MKASERWTTAAAAAFFLAACAVVLRWLWSGVFLSEIQSDTVETLFWAEAARESGGLFGSTFHYSYFIPFGGNLLIRPFLPLFGMDLAAHRAGMSLFVLVFAFACYRLFRSFRWARAESLLASSMLFAVAAASLKMREIYFGHVIYYSLGTVFLFLGCALAPDFGDGGGGARRARTLRGAIFALVLAWAASCGKPLLLYAVVPVLGAWVVVRLGESKPLAPLRDGLRLLPGVAGAAVGLFVFLAISRDVRVVSEYSEHYEEFSPLASWFRNMQILPQEWISLLDPLPNAKIAIASPAGLPHALRIATAVLLGAAPVAALFRIRSFSRRERLFAIAHWILAAEILFYWAFGNVSSANWRLSPLVLSSSAVAACLVRDLVVRGDVPMRRFGVCAALFLAGFVLLSSIQVCALPCEREAWRGRKTLLSVLEALDIRDGYCSDYWYANVATAVSGNRFRLREVRFNKSRGEWAPRLFNSDSRWYEPDPERTRTVFVCHAREASNAPQQGLVAHYRCSQKTGRLGYGEPLIVFVYDGDCLHPGTAPDEL
jgi:hypothetical protein